MRLVFDAHGQYRARQYEFVLRLRGEHVLARRRELLDVGGAREEPVLVVSGPVLFNALSPDEQAELRVFSETVSSSGGSGVHSEVFAYKNCLAHGLRSGIKARDIRGVVWRYGPVPVLMVGSACGMPVCVTPYQARRGRVRTPILDERAVDGRRVVMEVIGENFRKCMETYFRDIADAMVSIFHQHKNVAAEALFEVERVLGGSVRPKLAMLCKPNACDTDEVALLRQALHDQYESELRFYEAAFLVVKSLVCAVRASLGIHDAANALDELTGRARDALAGIAEGLAGERGLGECLSSLCARPPLDALYPQIGGVNAPDSWVADLKLACHFVAHALWLSGKYGAHSVKVFVSHYMTVLPTVLLYERLEQLAATHKRWQGRIVVWTGSGQPPNIALSILTMIWLSDSQLLLVPNTLATLTGESKRLPSEGDWVVEELYFGQSIGVPLHVLLFEGVGTSQVLPKFLQQVKAYRWSSLPWLVAGRNSHKVDLHGSLSTHLRQQSWTLHRLDPKGISPDNVEKLEIGVFEPALESRLLSTVLGLALSMERDHLAVAHALYKASKAAGANGVFGYAQLHEVCNACPKRRSSDGAVVTKSWVKKAIHEYLLHKKAQLTSSATEFVVPLVVEGPPAGHEGTYRFSLLHILDHVHEAYGLELDMRILRQRLIEAFLNPRGFAW